MKRIATKTAIYDLVRRDLSGYISDCASSYPKDPLSLAAECRHEVPSNPGCYMITSQSTLDPDFPPARRRIMGSGRIHVHGLFRISCRHVSVHGQ